MRDLLPRVTLNVVPQMAKTAASMTVQLVDGTRLAAETPLALGNPGNSMQWADMEQKFLGVVEFGCGLGRVDEDVACEGVPFR